MNRFAFKVVRAQAELHHAYGTKVKQIVSGLVLLTAVLGSMLVYVHVHYGYQLVMLLLMFIVGIAMASTLTWLGSVMNDRSQQTLIEMMLYIRSGVSEILKQEAHTHGELDRSQIRVSTQQQVQGQLIDASRQIIQERRGNRPDYIFDEEQGAEIEGGNFKEIS